MFSYIPALGPLVDAAEEEPENKKCWHNKKKER